jgi:hypothetical protein
LDAIVMSQRGGGRTRDEVNFVQFATSARQLLVAHAPTRARVSAMEQGGLVSAEVARTARHLPKPLSFRLDIAVASGA